MTTLPSVCSSTSTWPSLYGPGSHMAGITASVTSTARSDPFARTAARKNASGMWMPSTMKLAVKLVCEIAGPKCSFAFSAASDGRHCRDESTWWRRRLPPPGSAPQWLWYVRCSRPRPIAPVADICGSARSHSGDTCHQPNVAVRSLLQALELFDIGGADVLARMRAARAVFRRDMRPFYMECLHGVPFRQPVPNELLSSRRQVVEATRRSAPPNR